MNRPLDPEYSACSGSLCIRAHEPARRAPVNARVPGYYNSAGITTLVLMVMALGRGELGPTDGGPADPGPRPVRRVGSDHAGDAQTWAHGLAISPFMVPAVNAGLGADLQRERSPLGAAPHPGEAHRGSAGQSEALSPSPGRLPIIYEQNT